MYQEGRTDCPRTCANPYLICSGTGHDGCSCPTGQVIDEKNRRCVYPRNCPSKCYTMKNTHQAHTIKCYVFIPFFNRNKSM